MMRRKKTAQEPSHQFGEWLVRTLAERDISQSKFAKAVGVSDSLVTRWKSGTQPSIEACQRIAEFFGVDPLRLAVTAGRVPAEVAGVEGLPLPDDSARALAERQKMQELIEKKLSRSEDREALLSVLEVLEAKDGIENEDDTEKIAEALDRADRAIAALTQLLKPLEGYPNDDQQ
jgi:transcriptional regulator with XRE-family HTH domain